MIIINTIEREINRKKEGYKQEYYYYSLIVYIYSPLLLSKLEIPS